MPRVPDAAALEAFRMAGLAPPPPPLFRGRRPNALHLPFPPLCTLCPMPVALRGSHLPISCVPVTRWAGPLAGSISLRIPLLSSSSPMPSPLPHPPLSSRPHFCPHLRSRSRPVMTARGIPQMHLIAASTYAASTFQCSPLTPTLSHLVPLSRLPPHLVPVHSPRSLALRPYYATWFPLPMPLSFPLLHMSGHVL